MSADLAPAQTLEIPRAILDAMVEHCLREAPLECCGILCGIAPLVSLFYPLRNDMKSETRYNADPHDLIAAHIDFRRSDLSLQVLECFKNILAHQSSHPRHWEGVLVNDACDFSLMWEPQLGEMVSKERCIHHQVVCVDHFR